MRKAHSKPHTKSWVKLSPKSFCFYSFSSTKIYAHLHRWSQSAWSSKCWSWQGWADMWPSCIQCSQRTCANVNYDTHNVVFEKFEQYMKQIAHLLAVNINYYESLFWWNWHFEEIDLDLCKPTEMCVQICKNEYGKTSGSQTGCRSGNLWGFQVGENLWAVAIDTVVTRITNLTCSKHRFQKLYNSCLHKSRKQYSLFY